MWMTVRARLTLAVGVVFGVSAVVSAIIGVRVLEAQLVDAARDSATQVLGDYLESVNGGVASVGVIDEAATTRFFYLDADGQEITEARYFATIVSDLEAELAQQIPELVDSPAVVTPGGGTVALPSTIVPYRLPDSPWAMGGDRSAWPSGVLAGGAAELLANAPLLGVDPVTGELVDADGVVITFAAGPVPTGELDEIDVGPDAVAVAQSLELMDGSRLQVGVSAPLGPVTDSLDTLRTGLWVVVPLLIAAVVALTHVVAGRALRPVALITREAETIGDGDLGRRVPEPPTDDEVGRLAGTVNEMLARLEVAQHQQRQLVADASHELRSPIAASRAQLEVALASGVGVEEAARVVLREQERLGDLVDDLLALSRMDEGGTAEWVLVDVADLVRGEAARLSVDTTVKAPTTLPAEVQLASFRRLVRNLLDNAERHARRHVVVWAEQIGDELVLEVSDDGPGVPVEDRERVFDRFVRLDDARDRASGGAGLGLAIVRGAARAHGGRVRCDRSPAGGASFSVRLPMRTGT